MDLIQKIVDKDIKSRILAYGVQKTKKTWWAAKAAEAGFNVVLFDGDDGWHILKHIAPEAQRRIKVIDCVDTLDKATFAVFLTSVLKKGLITWDEVAKQKMFKANKNTIQIDLTKLTKDTVLIVDSWTAFTWSLQLRYALENHIDLTDPEGSDWDFYGWGGRIATWTLNQLKGLQCHVIVVAHEVQYTKMNKKDKKKIDSQKIQVISTSGPHASGMGRYFSDCMKFVQHGEKNFTIEVFGTDEQEGGSRLIEPGVYKWDELTFKTYCEKAGIALPDKDLPLLDFTIEPAATLGGGETNVLGQTVVEVVEKKPVIATGLGTLTIGKKKT